MSEMRKLMESLDQIEEAGAFTGPLDEIADATDNNDHTYAMILGAQFLKLPHLERVFNKIYKKQMELGHMPQDLMDYRYEKYKEMMQLAKDGLAPEDFKKFHDAY